MTYDVVVVGGGPAGLQAALLLGRARKRVLLCDAGPRRNAAAVHIQGFVTRDGTPPSEFRAIARQQLQPYPDVEVREEQVAAILGHADAFSVTLESGPVTARRIVLATGMIDQLPGIEGLRELWGKSVFICPYCHAWEVQDRAFAFLAPNPELLDLALLLRGWSSRVVVLTDGKFTFAEDARARLERAAVTIEPRPIRRLVGQPELRAVEFVEGADLPLDVLFVRPIQRQVAVVAALGLALDEAGYLRLDDHRQTSIRGIYAGGDLATPMQSAILAAAGGAQAAAFLNHDLAVATPPA